MKLLIDIGNTYLKYAFYDDDRNIGKQSSVLVPSDRFGEFAKDLSRISVSGVKEAWIVSVAKPEITELVTQQWLADLAQNQVHVITVTAEFSGFTNQYFEIDKLGADRWVAAIGARKLQPLGDLIVIDAGTAVTIDWLDRDNRFQGGVILPGARLMHESLVGQTANIQATLSESSTLIGRNTTECVNAGVRYGMIGAVNYVIRQMMNHVNRPVVVVLAGGMAEMLKDETKAMLKNVLNKEYPSSSSIEVIPNDEPSQNVGLIVCADLVLQGLAYFADKGGS